MGKSQPDAYAVESLERRMLFAANFGQDVVLPAVQRSEETGQQVGPIVAFMAITSHGQEAPAPVLQHYLEDVRPS